MKFEDYYGTIQPIDDLKKQLAFLQASLDELQNKYFSLEENYYTLEKVLFLFLLFRNLI